MAQVELAIPARSAYLSLVRLVVDAAVATLAPRLGAAKRDDLKVAVTEACSNAIDAHRAAWGDGPVYVRCNLGEEAVSVEVVDQGAGFDPDRVETLPAATALRCRPIASCAGLGVAGGTTCGPTVSSPSTNTWASGSDGPAVARGRAGSRTTARGTPRSTTARTHEASAPSTGPYGPGAAARTLAASRAATGCASTLLTSDRRAPPR